MVNIVKGMDIVSRTVKQYIYEENQPGGLLEHVETIIPTMKNDDTPLDPPVIWIAQHPTVPYQPENGKLSHIEFLKTTFEFVCVEYDDDIVEADYLGQKLATLVGASILRNFNKIKVDSSLNERIFNNVKFNAFYPVGEVNIVNKVEKVPATAILFDFIHTIDWLNCVQQK